jgi:hypothetical protein
MNPVHIKSHFFKIRFNSVTSCQSNRIWSHYYATGQRYPWLRTHLLAGKRLRISTLIHNGVISEATAKRYIHGNEHSEPIAVQTTIGRTGVSPVTKSIHRVYERWGKVSTIPSAHAHFKRGISESEGEPAVSQRASRRRGRVSEPAGEDTESQWASRRRQRVSEPARVSQSQNVEWVVGERRGNESQESRRWIVGRQRK